MTVCLWRVKMVLCYMLSVFLCVYVHSGRRQGRCFEQRAAEHQATTGGDRRGKAAARGGDGSGNILSSLHPHLVTLINKLQVL